MRASQFTMLLSIAALLGWTGVPAAWGQSAGPAMYQVSGNLASDVSAGQPCSAQQEPQGTCAGPLADLFPGICDPCRCSPCWTFAAEGIVLQRSNTRSQTLFEGGTIAPVEILNSKDLNFPVEVGPQVSAIRQIGCSPFAVEVAYFQVDGFAAHRDLPGLSIMVTDVNGPHFTVTDATALYTSAIYMGDVNVRWQWLDWLTLLSGFRMGQLNEHYHAAGTGTFAGEPVTLDVSALNNLYGYQLGADIDLPGCGGPLQIKSFCRAAHSATSPDRTSTALTAASPTSCWPLRAKTRLPSWARPAWC